jgi:hypothetical protein
MPKWKCPNADCPPTDRRPSPCLAMGDDVAMSVCGGECGQEYPSADIRRVA